MARFQNSDELRQHVFKKAKDLPPQQRAIADFLISHFEEVPFLALPELAGLTNVSEPTIVRFAQSIGFRGYRDLRMEMLQLPSNQNAAPPPEPIPVEDPRNVPRSVANLETENIRGTIEKIDMSTFNQIADALFEAKHTFLFGLGVSVSPVVMAHYVFTMVGVRCSILSSHFTSPTEPLIALGPSDLLLAFSFPPYSRQTLDVLQGAGERGALTAVITDSLGSPASAVAKWTLTAQTNNMMFSNALAAINVMINALATQYALSHRSHSLKAFAHVTKAMTSTAAVVEKDGGEDA